MTKTKTKRETRRDKNKKRETRRDKNKKRETRRDKDKDKKRKKMGGGIMPVALRNGVLVVLLGREREEKLWADFGGGGENNETPFMTAIREGGEELNGYLGTGKHLSTLVRKNKLTEIMNGDKYGNSYVSYLFNVSYSKDLPHYFNNNDLFIREKIPYEIERSKKTHNGLFEKDEIKWFSVEDIKRNISKFRAHLVPIMEEVILREKSLITELLN